MDNLKNLQKAIETNDGDSIKAIINQYWNREKTNLQEVCELLEMYYEKNKKPRHYCDEDEYCNLCSSLELITWFKRTRDYRSPTNWKEVRENIIKLKKLDRQVEEIRKEYISLINETESIAYPTNCGNSRSEHYCFDNHFGDYKEGWKSKEKDWTQYYERVHKNNLRQENET